MGAGKAISTVAGVEVGVARPADRTMPISASRSTRTGSRGETTGGRGVSITSRCERLLRMVGGLVALERCPLLGL